MPMPARVTITNLSGEDEQISLRRAEHLHCPFPFLRPDDEAVESLFYLPTTGRWIRHLSKTKYSYAETIWSWRIDKYLEIELADGIAYAESFVESFGLKLPTQMARTINEYHRQKELQRRQKEQETDRLLAIASASPDSASPGGGSDQEDWIIGTKPDLCAYLGLERESTKSLNLRVDKGEIKLEKAGTNSWKMKVMDHQVHQEAERRKREADRSGNQR